MITGVYNPQNIKDILVALGILLDGQYRENTLPAGVFNFIEKYTRTAGNAPSGLYCYNFCLDTSPYVSQPSGAMNTNCEPESLVNAGKILAAVIVEFPEPDI